MRCHTESPWFPGLRQGQLLASGGIHSSARSELALGSCLCLEAEDGFLLFLSGRAGLHRWEGGQCRQGAQPAEGTHQQEAAGDFS